MPLLTMKLMTPDGSQVSTETLRSQTWENSWSMLRSLSTRSTLPWVCIGDFNEILYADEKQGWLNRSERQMLGFQDALDFCRLKDLGV